jgi:hypothetical protein
MICPAAVELAVIALLLALLAAAHQQNLHLV